MCPALGKRFADGHRPVDELLRRGQERGGDAVAGELAQREGRLAGGCRRDHVQVRNDAKWPTSGERQRANSLIGDAPRFADRPRPGIRAQKRYGGGKIRIDGGGKIRIALVRIDDVPAPRADYVSDMPACPGA